MINQLIILSLYLPVLILNTKV